MRKLLPALLLASAALLPGAAPAAGLGADAELLIRCGAGYMFVAADDEVVDDQAEADNLQGAGVALLEQADDLLVERGFDGDAREKIAFDLATEVASALEAETDPGFEVPQCAALVEAAAAAVDQETSSSANSEEIDRLMTCGAGFYVTSESAKEEGDADTASSLGALAETLIGRAEELMIADGMGDEARFQVSQLYGEQVATKIYAGEELAYDWDTCASLAY